MGAAAHPGHPPPPVQQSGPRPHPSLPPQTPPPWELPQQYANWQQPPPVHDRPGGGGGGERRKTVLIVTIAVVLVVAAVLLGAFILRGKLNTGSLDRPAAPASVTVSAAFRSPPAAVTA